MASVKVKFRPSSIDGKEGSIYYQVIYNKGIFQRYPFVDKLRHHHFTK